MRKEKVRIHSWNLKKQAVARMKAGENISKLAREMKVSRSMLYTWKADVEAGIAFQPIRVPISCLAAFRTMQTLGIAQL